MAGLSRDKAADLVNKIAEKHGYVTPERLQRFKANLREDWEYFEQNTLRPMRISLGASTKILSDNLYSTDVRFLYELIQNAEDNSYFRALREGNPPSIIFRLYSEKLVIDSNEDGFSEKDLSAICSTSQSSKTGGGYIGHKGIGFKSVFKVASKAHIQSGPFSFSFSSTRESDSDGLGLVTPVNEKFETLPPGIQTRITLTLLGEHGSRDRESDLLSLPESTILFLSKLKSIQIQIHPRSTRTLDLVYTRVDEESTEDRRIVIKRNEGDEEQEKEIKYVIARRSVNDLPESVIRRDSHTEVQLAFPIDEDGDPIISDQYVFAHLPLVIAGFNFLIHSDFETQASRENVSNSHRNNALREAVAMAFCDAVDLFNERSLLCHQWMAFFPNSSVNDPFWAKLCPEIIEYLSNSRILRSWSGKGMFRPKKLSYLGSKYRDEEGEPLLRDLSPEKYLGKQYEREYFNVLKSLGTGVITISNFLERLAADLEKPDSVWKCSDTSEEWHLKVATVISEKVKLNTKEFQALQAMPLVPLDDESWVAQDDYLIYFPETEEGSIIPADLGFNLLDYDALPIKIWKETFQKIGIEYLQPPEVSDRIRWCYNCSTSKVSRKIHRKTSYHHLRFLYENHDPDEMELSSNIGLIDSKGKYRGLNEDRTIPQFYFKNETDDLGPYQLLQGHLKTDSSAQYCFINNYYISQSESPSSPHHDRSWTQWLEDAANVMSIPKLVKSGSEDELSEEFHYIASKEPSKLLPLLHKNWEMYRGISREAKRRIGETLVPSKKGQSLCLKTAYMPTEKLKSIWNHYCLGTCIFLDLDVSPNEMDTSWDFLKEFGVRFDDDCDFYNIAVKEYSKDAENVTSCVLENNLFELYKKLQQKYSQDEENIVKIREQFVENKQIYIPQGDSQAPRWIDIEYCRWEGEEWTTELGCLARYDEYTDLQVLFKNALKIRNVDWKDAIEELDARKRLCGEQSVETITEIYKFLWFNFSGSSHFEPLRTAFSERNLIYDPSTKDWVSCTSCLWASDRFAIPGKALIGNAYPSLELFFTEMLEIKPPSVSTHVEALISASRSLSTRKPLLSPSQVKAHIVSIASLKPQNEDLRSLANANIFHVRRPNGTVSYTMSSVEFAIPDQRDLYDHFKDKIIMLDFTLREIAKSKKFFEALGLKSRYLTNLAQEKTSFDRASMDDMFSHSFQSKARAITRYAVYYDSPKAHNVKELFSSLSCTSIYKSTGITKTITVIQNSVSHEVKGSKSTVHLNFKKNRPEIYLPIDRKEREFAFLRQLPDKLIKLLSIFDPAANGILYSILNATSVDVADWILEDAGIPDLDELDEAARGLSHRSIDSESTAIEILSSMSRIQSSQTFIERPRESIVSASNQQRGVRQPTPNLEQSRPVSPEETNPYANILENAIRAASSIEIPRAGHSSSSNHERGINRVTFDDIYQTRTRERDFKVGAAGELFVFELLKNQRLRGFGLENWRSKIRTHANVHPSYRDLAAWSGIFETTDLVYDDDEGKLATILFELGYINFDNVGHSDTIRFFIEVKATARSCSEPFFMSNAQYNMIQEKSMVEGELSKEIYMLCRVFNVDQDNVGLKIFVDPWRAKTDGILNFSVDTWTVRSAQ